MKNFNFPKSYILLFVFFICSIAFFVLGQNDGNNPPSALNYAPNFQFDPDEQYYPTDPLDFYFVNGEEIEGAEARAKYNNLSFAEKTNNIVVFYHIEDEGDHWVYQYWTFFVFNDNPVLVKNKHYSDWEAVFVFVNKETKEVIRTVGTAHHRKTFDIEIESPETNHIWAYVANGSHAICVDKEGDEYCNFLKWRAWEKWSENGHKAIYNEYELKEIIPEYIAQFNGAITLTKSPILGINLINWLGFWESEEIEASESIFVIKLGGGTSDYPWEQSMYHNPEETRPRNAGYAMEIVGNFWDELFGGDNGLTFQSAGIGGALVSSPASEIIPAPVVAVEEVKKVEAIEEVREIKEVKKVEKIEEIIIIEEEKIEAEVEEIKEEIENESAVPAPY
ncbi:hypothetical protein KJ756_03025, partial [Patescibacteria group bacterium]|nr:hypothetical protein [Patescibacteria group bacterium]